MSEDRQGTSRSTAKPLAIVGMGALFPKAGDLERYWANIKRGVDAIEEVPASHWRPEDYYSADQKTPDFTYGQRGGFLEGLDFDPLKYGIPPNVIEATDTSQLLGLVAAEMAMQDAGYGADKEFDRERVSVILGVTGALELVVPLGARLGHPIWRKSLQDAGLPEDVVDDVVHRISEGYVSWQENSFPGLLGNVVAGRISKYLDTGATNCVVDAACASSLSALHLAALELESGKIDMAVTGGVDTFNDIFMYMCFSKTPALSPTGDAKPFDKDGDGTILGEGLGLLVLKRLEDAERDEDKIYAVLKGVGSSSDGKGDAIYAPSSPGQMKALREAYRVSGVDPQTIGMVEAHGTGTSKGDAVEVRALHEVFADVPARSVALGSVKSQIGHTKAAAGSAGLIKAALALHHKVIPPTIKVTEPLEILQEAGSPFFVNTAATPWTAAPDHPRRAAVSSFGFGGSNFHCVLEEYSPQKAEPDWDGTVQILAFSSDNVAGLTAQLNEVPRDGDWNALRAAAKASRDHFDGSAAHRLAIVVEQGIDWDAQFAKAAKLLNDRAGQTAWSTPDGIHYGSEAPEGDVAFVFPGQGAQYPGMLRDIVAQFPEALETVEGANAILGKDVSLAERIFPYPKFSKSEKDADAAALTATEVAQPAIGVASLAAAKVLARFGVTASAAAGHSYGELTALCAAGRLREEDFVRLSRTRGALMGAGDGDKGSMLAVRAPLADIESVIAEEGLDVIVANKNAPEQSVLSGGTAAIDSARDAFKARKMTCTKLPVAAAFHSSLVSDAAGPFLDAVRAVPFAEGTIPVYANTTGEAYPCEEEDAQSLLANQLANPVEFVSMIEAMYASGARSFVEVGPGGRMTGLVKAILGDRPHSTSAIDAGNGKKNGVSDLARVLAQLAAEGRAVALTEWDSKFSPAPTGDGKKRLTVALTGANHRSDYEKRPPKKALAHESTAPANPVSSTPPPAHAPTSPVASVTSSRPAAQPAQASTALYQQTQANIAALQQMQEQTARLHQQFLAGQEQAAKTFQLLLQQQSQTLVAGGTIAPVLAPAPAPVAPPAAAPAVEAISPGSNQAPAVESTVPAGADSGLTPVLLEVVADKTGYPSEMLELSMSLDADLGIDSIKRVEILSALQEAMPGLPSVDAEELGSIQTLQDIVDRLASSAPQSASGAISASTAASTSTVLQDVLLAVVADKTGYPSEMLELSMSLDADLGIDSIKRVEILSAMQERAPELPAVEAEALGQLQTLQDVIDHLAEAVPAAANGASAATSAIDVTPTLLEVVSEKTGYPSDMLELSMSLDADLGIDSIKRVEILSAMQERMPELPHVEAEALGQLQTLQDVIDHLAESTGANPASQNTSASAADVTGLLLEVVSEKTGYPVDMLELTMGLEADLGIDSIKRVEILSAMQERVPALPQLEAEALGQLETLQDVIDVMGSAPEAVATAPAESAPKVAEERDERPPLRQVVRVTSLAESRPARTPRDGARIAVVRRQSDTFAAEVLKEIEALGCAAIGVEPGERCGAPLDGLVVVSPADADDAFVKGAFGTVQNAAQALAESGKGFFATVSRLDGAFGFGDLAADANPLAGTLAGLSKTASHEWPTVSCRAIDVAPSVDAKALLAELFCEGPLETGLTESGASTLALEQEGVESSDTPTFGPDDVIVVSGGARGVTAEVVCTLAEATRASFVLLGRSPAPADEEAWLQDCETEAAIKKAIVANASEKLSPRDVGNQCARVLAAREIRATLARIEASGARARYAQVDVCDAEAVHTTLAEARAALGPITGIVHGAGVLADRLITDKTAEQFDRVYDTKVAGLRSLLEATADDALKTIVLFSSSTGRFGRKGQVDYAIANEALNKTAQVEARKRPEATVLSVNWGPWDGGMVTPELRKVFEAEGVGVIGLRAGAEYLLRELASHSTPAEVTVLGAGTIVEAPRSDTKDTQASLEIPIDVESCPFLSSHVLDGKAVLPVAMYAEWFAHAALHENPGLRFGGVRDLKVFKGVILESEERRTLQFETAKPRKESDTYLVDVTLRSDAVNHAAATVVLCDALPKAPGAADALESGENPYASRDIYGNGVLFHGEAFHGIDSVVACGNQGIRVSARTAPRPTAWIAEPLRKNWIAEPLVLDCAFQAMILWSQDQLGAGSLPVRVGRYTQFVRAFPKGHVTIQARVVSHNAHRAVAEIDFVHPSKGTVLARIEDYECVIDPSLNDAFQRSELAHAK